MKKAEIRRFVLVCSVVPVFLLGASNAFCQNDSLRVLQRGRSLFDTHCAPCHAVHKARMGPMLASITRKRSKEWLHEFIRNSQKVIVSGDPYAAHLFRSFNQQVMPAFRQLSDSAIGDILFYIKKESLGEGRDPDHSAVRQFSNPQVLHGKEIFASQCANCHSIDKEEYGPALGSVGKRLPEEWLVAFIRNSTKVIEGGDPYAEYVFNAFDRKVMVPMEFLTDGDIRAVLDYIEFVSSSTHPVAGVNGRPLPGPKNERRAAVLPAHEGGEESSFKIPFMVLAILAACVHGYLIVKLFRYLNTAGRHRS